MGSGLLLALCTLVLCTGLGQADDKYTLLEQWIVDGGGKVNAYVGTNKAGYRGLFAKESIPTGEAILSVSGGNLINAGSGKGSFLTPTLMLLREQLHPHSRFKPYMDTFPPREQVINACTLDKSLWDLMESDYWLRFINSWQSFLEQSLAGKANLDLEITIPEMLGNVARNLTLDDLKQACGLSATRYVASGARDRLLMIPMFDMANHKRDCLHYLTGYGDSDMIHMVAGSDLAKDEEICFSYGQTRDDFLFIHYGFLPDVEDPPRLLMVDHHQFNPELHSQSFTEEVFSGESAHELAGELARLQQIREQLKKYDEDAKVNNTRPARGTSHVADLLLDLQARRRAAIDYEIARIQGLLRNQNQEL